MLHLIDLLRDVGARRKWLLLLIVPFCAGVGLWSSVPNLPTNSGSFGGPHPIELLVGQAQIRFVNALSSSSTTVDEAVLNYRARYGRDPPPKFDKWFELAQRHDFMLVDEFDTIMDSLEPYWQISPAILRARSRSILTEDTTLVRVSIRDGQVERNVAHREIYQANVIHRWLRKTGWLALLPDMVFLVNRFDEPRGECASSDNFDLQPLMYLIF
jgi:hypothetical protein